MRKFAFTAGVLMAVAAPLAMAQAYGNSPASISVGTVMIGSQAGSTNSGVLGLPDSASSATTAAVTGAARASNRTTIPTTAPSTGAKSSQSGLTTSSTTGTGQAVGTVFAIGGAYGGTSKFTVNHLINTVTFPPMP